MSEPSVDIYVTIMGFIVLIINCATMMIMFERKHKLRYGIIFIILYTILVIIYRQFTAYIGFDYKGSSAFIYIPLMVWLLKGPLFQKIFTFFFQYVCMISQYYLAEAIVGIFISRESEHFSSVLFVPVMFMYTAYILLMVKYGKSIFNRLLVNGRTVEWGLYSFGAAFSFIVLTISRDYPYGILHYILLILFIIWSFGILCFAIINTHEKVTRGYEAEHARDIISSGRDHYQKMHEMYDKLRILRHDYKYHLNAARRMLHSDHRDEADNYLSSVEAMFSENELINYCDNSVINALVASYAERYQKQGIAFDVEIYLPKNISIPNYEMCIILGNLLENALEANKSKQDVQKIVLTVKNHNEQLAVKVTNNYNNIIIDNGGHPISMKKNGGVGLKSVQAVAERYGGELITEWDSETFTAYVLMVLA